MNWRATDDEAPGETRPVTEPRTVREVSRCVGIAIGRWLMAGVDCPDMEATDGVSIIEADMELAESET